MATQRNRIEPPNGLLSQNLEREERRSLDNLHTIYKGGENEFTTCVIWRRARQDGDGNYNKSSNGPGESPFGHIRKQRIAESIEQKRHEVVNYID